jgi:hypothetical protein
MNDSDSSDNHIPAPGWQLLGLFDLTSEQSSTDAIGPWLVEILSPLQLDEDFLNRVLGSADEAALNAIKAGSSEKSLYARLKIFAPRKHVPTGQMWGFFRIENIGSEKQSDNFLQHMIEFFLYVEGG